MHVLQGIVGMVLGFCLLVFRPQIKRFVGRIDFAEQYLGMGGTWTALAIFGIALFVFSLMWATGTIQGFFNNNLSQFFY